MTEADENKLLRHDIASYLETMGRTCELLGIDLESAKHAGGKPSDVLYSHAKELRDQLAEARGIISRVHRRQKIDYADLAHMEDFLKESKPC